MSKYSKKDLVFVGLLIGNLPTLINFVSFNWVPNYTGTNLTSEEMISYQNGIRDMVIVLLPLILTLSYNYIEWFLIGLRSSFGCKLGICMCVKFIGWLLYISIYLLLSWFLLSYIVLKLQGNI